MVQLDDFFGPNAGYAAELFERYQQDPEEVDAATRAVFARVAPPPAAVQPPLTEALRPSPQISSAAAAASLAQGIRLFGHRAAQLDPLGSESPGDPQLDYAAHGLSDADLQSLPAGIIGGPVVRAAGIETAADAIQR